MKTNIWIIIIILGVLCAPAIAWPAPAYQGDIYQGQTHVFTRMGDGGDYTELDALCTANYPGKPFGMADARFSNYWVGSVPTFSGGEVMGLGSPVQYIYPSGSFTLNFTPNANYYAFYSIGCSASGRNVNNYATNIVWKYWNLSASQPPFGSANFTGTPTGGFIGGTSGLNVLFTETTTPTVGTIQIWNFGDGQIVNGTYPSVSHTYVNPGVYTVRMDTYKSLYGWHNLTKSNYITVSAQSGIVVNLDVKDSTTGALIQGAGVGIKNVTSGVWRNSTAPTGLVYFDSTGANFEYPLSVNQTITLAASMTGYQPASTTFAIPYHNYRAMLNLVPTTIVNATGKGTVVASVVRDRDGTPISAVSLVLDSGEMGVSNSAGVFTFVNISSGTRRLTASDPGMQTGVSTFNLSAGETKLVQVQLVYDGATPRPTFGTPEPSPTITDSNGNPITNVSTGQINAEGSTGILGMLGMLFQLWPAVVLFLFIAFMKACMSS